MVIANHVLSKIALFVLLSLPVLSVTTSTILVSIRRVSMPANAVLVTSAVHVMVMLFPGTTSLSNALLFVEMASLDWVNNAMMATHFQEMDVLHIAQWKFSTLVSVNQVTATGLCK